MQTRRLNEFFIELAIEFKHSQPLSQENWEIAQLFYTIQGGGHSWSGGEPLPEIIVGETSQDIDATNVMWEFFEQHPLAEIP